MNTHTEQEIEKILNSIDGIERAEMSPFFITKLNARLEQKAKPSIWEQIAFSVFSKPAFTVATLLVFVVLNITTIGTLMNDTNLTKNNPKSAQEASLQSFVQDYNLSVSNIYNNEQKLP